MRGRIGWMACACLISTLGGCADAKSTMTTGAIKPAPEQEMSVAERVRRDQIALCGDRNIADQNGTFNETAAEKKLRDERCANARRKPFVE